MTLFPGYFDGETISSDDGFFMETLTKVIEQYYPSDKLYSFYKIANKSLIKQWFFQLKKNGGCIIEINTIQYRIINIITQDPAGTPLSLQTGVEASILVEGYFHLDADEKIRRQFLFFIDISNILAGYTDDGFYTKLELPGHYIEKSSDLRMLPSAIVAVVAPKLRSYLPQYLELPHFYDQSSMSEASDDCVECISPRI